MSQSDGSRPERPVRGGASSPEAHAEAVAEARAEASIPTSRAGADEAVAADQLAVAVAEASIPTSRAGADEAVAADQHAAAGAAHSPADSPADLPAEPADRRSVTASLWRDGNFLRMWSGQALSQFGAQITELALPVLAVLVLNATEWEAGVLNASAVAAFLVVGLPAGAWIDRLRKRHVMIWADAVRAVALCAVPALWWLDVLQMWHLFVVALIMGVATVFFDVSNQSIVPSLVRPGQIADANGKLQSTEQLAGLAGPAVGGWLIGAITAPFAIIVTVVTYVASFFALIFTTDHEQPHDPATRRPLRHEIAEGLRWVFGNRYLKRIVATTAVANFFNTMSFTLLPIFLLRELGLSPEAMGLIFSLGAAGGLLGAIVTPRIVGWVGEARAIPIGAIGFSVVPMFLPVAALVPEFAFPLLVVQGFVMSFLILLYNITQVTFRQRITPPRLLGRMNASVRFCVWGVMPIAALLSGVVGEWIGTVPTMWIAATGQLLAGAFVVFGPFWTMRELPDAAADADGGAAASVVSDPAP